MASRLRKGRLGGCLGWVDGYLRVVCGAVIGNSGDLGLERARFWILRVSWGGYLLPLVLALQCFLGSLQLLDALGVVYYPIIHKATRAVRFELGCGLVLPLVMLLVLRMVVWSPMFV